MAAPRPCITEPSLILSRFGGLSTIPARRQARIADSTARLARAAVRRAASRPREPGMDYQLKPLGKTCAQTGAKLLPGDVCYSAVVAKGNEWERLDFSRDAWKGPPDDAIGYWQMHRAGRGGTQAAAARSRRALAALRAALRRREPRAGQIPLRAGAAPGAAPPPADHGNAHGRATYRSSNCAGMQGEGPFEVREQQLEPDEIETLENELNQTPDGGARTDGKPSRRTKRRPAPKRRKRRDGSLSANRPWPSAACRGRRRPARSCAAAGCSMSLPFARNDLGPALPENAGVEEVVQRVNANIEHLQAWRRRDLRISGRSLPVHLTGHIAVERPRNFRLTAGALGMTDEADFGSNADWFWFWVRRGQPNYVFRRARRHGALRRASAGHPLPARLADRGPGSRAHRSEPGHADGAGRKPPDGQPDLRAAFPVRPAGPEGDPRRPAARRRAGTLFVRCKPPPDRQGRSRQPRARQRASSCRT